MPLRPLLIGAFGAAVLAGPSFAEDAPASAATATTAPQPDKAPARGKKEVDLDRVVCTHDYPVGSTIPKTVCLTIRERRAAADKDKQRLHTMNLESDGHAQLGEQR